MAFDPKAHMSKLKGKDYLEVKWRLVWFREDHPDWGIETQIFHFDSRGAVVLAKITDSTGRTVAMGTKQEQPEHFPDYLEKAETGAIGRALAALGYGTQFAPELEEGDRIVDSPVDRKAPTKPTTDKPETPKTEAQKPTLPTLPPKVITKPQLDRLFTIADAKGWAVEDAKAIIHAAGFASSKQITTDKYDAICKTLEAGPQVTADAN